MWMLAAALLLLALPLHADAEQRPRVGVAWKSNQESESFVMGIQFHPKIAVMRALDDTSLCCFTAIVEAAQ